MRNIFLALIFIFEFLYCTLNAQDKIEKEVEYLIGNYHFSEALNLISSQPASKVLMQKKAECLKNLNNYTEAVSIWSELAKVYPNDKQPIIELALCYQYMSNWDKSIECYSSLVKNDSTNTYFKIQLADAYMMSEKYTEALDVYRELFEVYNIDNMLRRIGVCYDKLNIADSAKVYYAKSWERDFFDTSSVTGLINLNIKEGKLGFADAIRVSDTYVSKDSTNKQINLLNALSYYAADLYEEAVARFEKCYVKGDSSQIVLRSLGLSYYSLGQKDNAYNFLQKAYHTDSTNINVLYALGVVANEKMDYDTGQKCFGMLIDRVVPPDFTLFQYYRNLGIAYEGKKDFLAAVNSYKKAVEHANDKQKMYLYYTIVSIYDVDLKLQRESLEYYELYKQSLSLYYNDLLKNINPDTLQLSEINITRAKLDALDKHINRLRKSLGDQVNLNNTPKVSSTLKINL